MLRNLTEIPPPARSQATTRRPRINHGESPVAWLHARGHLTRRQRDAGERLRADYERAALPGRITMMWDAPPASKGRRGPAPASEASRVQIDCRRHFDAAIARAGPGLGDILWRVACAGETLLSAERALGWPARSGKLVLALALDRVADYYRIR